MNVIDFCCGAGGATTGVHAAGAKLVAAYDIDPHALESHRANHAGAAAWNDLSHGDFRDLPGHEAAVWCPPCEDVSPASGRTAYAAAVPLMDRLLDYAEACRPRYILFENVPSIRGWRGHHDWRCRLEALGYWVTDGLVQAADFVPEERTRYICLAARGQRAPRMPRAHLKRPVPAREIIDTCTERGAWRFVADATPPQKARISRGRERFGPEFLLASYGTRGGMGGDHCGRSLDRPMATVTTSRQWLVVSGSYVRNVTPEECAAAQGFPARYRFEGAVNDQQRQIGRAIPVGLARAAFEALVS